MVGRTASNRRSEPDARHFLATPASPGRPPVHRPTQSCLDRPRVPGIGPAGDGRSNAPPPESDPRTRLGAALSDPRTPVPPVIVRGSPHGDGGRGGEDLSL